MLINDNGVVREMTPEEEAYYTELMNSIPVVTYSYEERVVMRIRERYSVDDEIALLRQRDTKPEEFAEYNAYVEQVKLEEKAKEEVL